VRARADHVRGHGLITRGVTWRSGSLLVKALLGLPVEPDPALLTTNVSLTHLFLPAPPPAAGGGGGGGGGGAVLRYLNRPPECGEL
jgi:hypothetical protein